MKTLYPDLLSNERKGHERQAFPSVSFPSTWRHPSELDILSSEEAFPEPGNLLVPRATKIHWNVHVFSLSSVLLTQSSVVISLEWASLLDKLRFPSPLYLLIHNREIGQWFSYSLLKRTNNAVERKTTSIWFETKTHKMFPFDIWNTKNQLCCFSSLVRADFSLQIQWEVTPEVERKSFILMTTEIRTVYSVSTRLQWMS